MNTRAKLTAAEILRLEYGYSSDPLTPNVLAHVLVGDGVAAELSEGLDNDGEPLFGVAMVIIRADGTTRRVGCETPSVPVRSALFRTRDAAEAHIETMREHLRQEAQPGLFRHDVPGEK